MTWRARPGYREERRRNLRKILKLEHSQRNISDNESLVRSRIGNKISCRQRFPSRTSRTALFYLGWRLACLLSPAFRNRQTAETRQRRGADPVRPAKTGPQVANEN